MSRKIIIDTDPGIDDAMAIFYALAAPALDVIGLTTVFGNAATSICTKNALRLLEIAGRADIPVAAGAERPLSAPFHGGADFVHGADGQGDTHLPDPVTTAHQQHAVQFIIDQVMQSPGEITLVALGPLTNVALALLIQPDLARHIGEIVLMGGNAFCPGNVSPAAEANIWNDAEAADIVFGADCAITMVGLDVTESIFMSPAVLDRIATFNNPCAQHLARILPFYRGFYAKLYGETGIHVHDSTTITYLLKPELFKTAQHPIRVETVGLSRGKTWPALGRSDQEAPWANRRKINICTGVDAEAAIATEMEYLQIP